jgi:hypothetical protein
MKKLLAFSAAVIIFVISGCNKLVDHIRDHLDGDDKTYRIERWDKAGGVYGPATTAVFTYNKKNDPIRVDYDNNTLRTGYTDWWFDYDNKGGLSKLYRTYGDNRDDWYQKMVFIYDNKGRIAVDTTFEMFWEPAVEEPYLIYWINHYTYDSKGRIVKVDEQQNPPRMSVEHIFTYDANGNRELAGLVYDNKLNFHQTNKIWMFLSRDYSMNNPAPAESYNEHGLPLVFNTPFPAKYGMDLLYREFIQATFTYKKN